MNFDASWQKLENYDQSSHEPQRPKWIIVLWYLTNYLAVIPGWNVSSSFKVALLRLFGAHIGKKLIIRPRVKIKYPWKLIIGNDCWIGEDVFIENLEMVILENNVCISQKSMLINGNHNVYSPRFNYYGQKIQICNEVWIGAGCIIGPGVICEKRSVLQLGSIATSKLKENGIYSGNPAKLKRWRIQK
jgi:putative colanic acid biosynthesis acetyltransferase WcaF